MPIGNKGYNTYAINIGPKITPGGNAVAIDADGAIYDELLRFAGTGCPVTLGVTLNDDSTLTATGFPASLTVDNAVVCQVNAATLDGGTPSLATLVFYKTTGKTYLGYTVTELAVHGSADANN